MIFLSNFLDIDECDIETDTCDVNADCNNTVGSFICTCHSGFSGNGETCEGFYLYLHILLLTFLCSSQYSHIICAYYVYPEYRY